eukprot:NODE_497_length_6803_cov_1.267900.p3 type:complete len:425 gc:universal NODE_497_length_6803_cov_1.267900:3570-2296(-)
MLFLLAIFALELELTFTARNNIKYKVITEKKGMMDLAYDCKQVSGGKSCGLNCCKIAVDKGAEFRVKQPQLDLLAGDISQGEQQITIFKSVVPNVSFDANKIKITLITKGKIKKADPKPVSQKSTKVVFELAKGEDFQIQFENSYYGPILEKYAKKVYIEHYSGIVNVFNKYTLVNRGSRLDYFNRADYMVKRQQVDNLPVVQEIEFSLPGGALEPWVRDQVGNISTSNFRKGKAQKFDMAEKPMVIKGKPSHLRIKPRYPLFGGWKFEFGNGYMLKSNNRLISGSFDELHGLLKKPLEIEKTNTYSPHYFFITVNLADLPKQYTAEHAVIEIVLPEGAHHIYVQAKVHSISLDHQKEFSYFDTIGRRKLVIKSHYLQDDQNIKILYSISPFDFKFRKLLTVSLGIFGIFSSILAISRVNLRLK